MSSRKARHHLLSSTWSLQAAATRRLRIKQLCAVMALVATATLSVAPSVAQPVAAPQNQAIPQNQATVPGPSQPPNEILVLKTQLEDAGKFQDQMLATVYWSLGTLVTIAALLVGFGWFANIRMYERDKSALERELRTLLLDEVRKAKDEANNASVARFSEQDKALANSLSLADERMTSKLEASQRILERSLEAGISSNASSLAGLRREVKNLQLESKLEERTHWLTKKVPRNTLQASTQALVIANDIGYEYGVAQVLDLLGRDIDSILVAKATPIDNFLMAQVVEALDAVVGGHAHAAATLKAKAAALVTA